MKVSRAQCGEELFAAVTPLLEQHFREVGNTAVYTLAPDWEKYRTLMSQGNLLALLAHEGEDCIGYSVSFMTPHVHYVGSKVCYNDVIFVRNDLRSGLAGAKLIAHTKAYALAEGVDVMQWHAKPNTQLNTALSKRLPVFEHVYSERL